MSSAVSATPRGPPKKPKQSGHALWCGNLPAQTHIVELKDYFSREATDDIESVFLISKSNCAFINYKSEESCAAALTRFHDSRFQGAKLVCRLRRGPAATPAGAPTGPRTSSISAVPSQVVDAAHERPEVRTSQEESAETRISREKAGDRFFVMKSLTVKDLDASLRSGSWATQSHNEDALKAAYEVSIGICEPTLKPPVDAQQSANNVYLVFSANKSGEYYGYARMASRIDVTTEAAKKSPSLPIAQDTASADKAITISVPATEHAPKGYITDDSTRGTIFWERERDENMETDNPQTEPGPADTADSDAEQQSLGHPFEIEWLSTVKLPFHRARGLRNLWNQNREVKIARDGTEIEPSVGRKLINLFHSTQAATQLHGERQLLFPAGSQSMSPHAYPLDPRFGRPC